MELKHNLLPYDGEAFLIRDYYDSAEADSLFQRLKAEIKWEEKEIFVFGKKVKQPRLSALYGDSNIFYIYSQTKFMATPWDNCLIKIKEDVSRLAQVNFNSCLLNLYRHGNDSMGIHADDEKELGKNPTLISLSFGISRKFYLTHSRTKEKIVIPLGHNSLLLMKGSTQHYWRHGIPKEKNVTTERINLTFRRIIHA